jgi:hypothetical protein
MLQGSSYVRYDHKSTNSVHKKHNTLRSKLIPPAVLGCLDRGQAHTPARWKRFSLPLAKKVAKQFVEAFRDAYGDALCLSAYYRDAEPSIRRAEVLASRTSPTFPEGGNENAGDVRGRLVCKRRSFFYCTGAAWKSL